MNRVEYVSFKKAFNEIYKLSFRVLFTYQNNKKNYKNLKIPRVYLPFFLTPTKFSYHIHAYFRAYTYFF